MTVTEIQNAFREAVRATARAQFNVDLDMIATETPPKTELGDIAFPVAFELAKKIKQATGEKKNPREIAETLKSALESSEFVGKAEVAGAGSLNVFFDRSRFLATNALAYHARSSGGRPTPHHDEATNSSIRIHSRV